MVGHGGALAQALRALDEERARLASERRLSEEARAAARAAEERARTREDAARRAERQAAAHMGEALADELDAARTEVSRLLAELQAAPTVRKATEAARQLEAWRSTISQAAHSAGAQAKAGPEALPGGELKKGARVRILSLGHEAEVIEVDGREALVRAGGLKIRRPVSDLLPLRGKAPAAPGFGKSRSQKLEAAEEARAAPVRAPDRRLDGRGLRVDDLLREVERFLDRLYAEGAPEAVILHGHGTGALKQALREHLTRSPYVRSFRRGGSTEGGDAVTVVALAGHG